MNLSEALDKANNMCKTDNGADALRSTGSACLDLFASAGSMRQASVDDKCKLFMEAYNEDRLSALKLLFYIRDIRGGYGERDFFNLVISRLADVDPDVVIANISNIAEFGRFKDLYSLIGTPAEDFMWGYMKNVFEQDIESAEHGEHVSLLAKWIATPNASSEKTRKLGLLTAHKLGYTFKTMSVYKKNLRMLRRIIDSPEYKMSTDKWDTIDYEKVPSGCMFKSHKAFSRHDDCRFGAYLANVNTGEAKINTGTLTPCDVLSKYRHCSHADDAVEALWNNLGDICEHNVLVMADTSGSMTGYGNEVSPMDVALSMAMYFGERNVGEFKNKFLTFSRYPVFHTISGDTLFEKLRNIDKCDWENNTDLKAAFDLVLDTAVKYHVDPDDMPKAIMVVSDMQIDNCAYGYDDGVLTFTERIRKDFTDAGYELPQVIYWNVNAKRCVFHASKSANGVSLVSGYSVNVMKQVMENIGRTPMDLMMDVLNSDRYNVVTDVM